MRSGNCTAAMIAVVGIATLQATAQSTTNCGQQGMPCCCKAGDWQNPRCCDQGQDCAMFGRQGYGALPVIQALCIPKKTQGCGGHGQPCCVGRDDAGYLTGTCSNGLSCIPGSTPFGSSKQFDKLAARFTASARDTAVVGTCKKFTAAYCGKAYMPCGKDIAAAGVFCSGNPTTCPAGFYCAAKFDAAVGERCIALPSNAGKAGGPCLPNNLPNAPVVDVKKDGVKTAPSFCLSTATCFTLVNGDTTGFTYKLPTEAKSLASRIAGTQCVEVPKDCGKGPGSTCCPSDYGIVTDKPLPSYGTKWAGDPCDSSRSQYGVYCSGNYVAQSGEPLGKCVANAQCGADGQPCCKYTNRQMGGVTCPRLGGPGYGYCNLSEKCRICPPTLYLVEDLLRCY